MLFDIADSNHDGYLTTKQFLTLIIYVLKIPTSKDKLLLDLQLLTPVGNDRIDFNSFTEWIIVHRPIRNTCLGYINRSLNYIRKICTNTYSNDYIEYILFVLFYLFY